MRGRGKRMGETRRILPIVVSVGSSKLTSLAVNSLIVRYFRPGVIAKTNQAEQKLLRQGASCASLSFWSRRRLSEWLQTW